jgi:hypothetical protein
MHCVLSDIDLVIFGVPSDKSQYKRLLDCLQQSRQTSYLEGIFHARYALCVYVCELVRIRGCSASINSCMVIR